MNKEIKKLWVDALRSGSYEQGKGCLNNADNGTFCCLGVLCDIAHEAGITSMESAESIDEDYVMYSYGGNKYALPYEVSTWAGLSSDDPVLVTEGGHHFMVSYLNDQEEYTFKQIADLVENQL